MSRTDILSLDIATNMGWCRGEPVGKPVYGSIRLAKTGASDAEVAASAIKWMAEQLKIFKPRMIVYEAAIPPRRKDGQTNFSTSKRLLGLPFLIEGVAYLSGVYNVKTGHVMSARKVFLGKGKPENPKAAVLARCRELGYSPPDDDAADAICLWHYACHTVGGAHE